MDDEGGAVAEHQAKLERIASEHGCTTHVAGRTCFRMSPSKAPSSLSPPSQLPDIVLVGCVKTKRAARSAAKDLYISPLWRYRRSYAERMGVPWYILSALHGLLDPDQRIDPYELALTDLRAKARRAWSARVLAELRRRVPSMRDRLIEIHAGATYIDHGLEEGLSDAGAAVHRPLAGISGIGSQQAWYRHRLDVYGKTDQPRLTARSDAARIAKLIADEFYGDGLDLASRGMALGQPWPDIPEVKFAHRLRTSRAALDAEDDSTLPHGVRAAKQARSEGGTDRAARLFLTFIAAMDRARDATQLWNAGGRLFERSPESFDPHHVAGLEVGALGRVLKAARVSQRHGPDSDAWHRIGKSLASGRKSPVCRVIDAGSGGAQELLSDLKSRSTNGLARFPMLRGPKIGPMWIRMMANPGRAMIDRIETIPVAVDVHVRRVTENLGVTATRGLPLAKAKPVIQETWTNGVSEADIAGPAGIEGTCAALDPALWFFGRHGCGHCEKAVKQVRFGRACDYCVRFR